MDGVAKAKGEEVERGEEGGVVICMLAVPKSIDPDAKRRMEDVARVSFDLVSVHCILAGEGIVLKSSSTSVSLSVSM